MRADRINKAANLDNKMQNQNINREEPISNVYISLQTTITWGVINISHVYHFLFLAYKEIKPNKKQHTVKPLI